MNANTCFPLILTYITSFHCLFKLILRLCKCYFDVIIDERIPVRSTVSDQPRVIIAQCLFTPQTPSYCTFSKHFKTARMQFYTLIKFDLTATLFYCWQTLVCLCSIEAFSYNKLWSLICQIIRWMRNLWHKIKFSPQMYCRFSFCKCIVKYYYLIILFISLSFFFFKYWQYFHFDNIDLKIFSQ